LHAAAAPLRATSDFALIAAVVVALFAHYLR
jgi:hypothetical protein